MTNDTDHRSDTELLDLNPSDKRYQELLNQPVPILEGNNPESYIRIRNTRPSTNIPHAPEIMPPGYMPVFLDDDTTAVRREIGEALIESPYTVEAVDESDSTEELEGTDRANDK